MGTFLEKIITLAPLISAYFFFLPSHFVRVYLHKKFDARSHLLAKYEPKVLLRYSLPHPIIRSQHLQFCMKLVFNNVIELPEGGGCIGFILEEIDPCNMGTTMNRQWN